MKLHGSRVIDRVDLYGECVATAGAGVPRSLGFPPVWRELVSVLAWLGAVAACAIGVSGGIAWLAGRLLGKAFVAGDPAGVTYMVARCRELFEYASRARTCGQAAIDHHFGEIVAGRVVVGVLGLAACCCCGGVAKPHQHCFLRSSKQRLRRASPPWACVLLFLDGLGRLISGRGHGAGGPLSGALLSGVLAPWFGRRLYRQLAARVASRLAVG